MLEKGLFVALGIVQSQQDYNVQPILSSTCLLQIFASGCEVRYVEGGHVSAAIFQQSQFRYDITLALDSCMMSL